MSNVVDFSRAAVGRHAANRFESHPPVHAHAVQFYDEDGFLTQAVAQYLSAGLRAGDRVIVIATEAHRNAFLA